MKKMSKAVKTLAMTSCEHVFLPLDSQNVQCEECTYVRHRTPADDAMAHPVKQITRDESISTDDLLDLLKKFPPRYPDHYVPPQETQWTIGDTWTDTGTNGPDYSPSITYKMPVKDFQITYTNSTV